MGKEVGKDLKKIRHPYDYPDEFSRHVLRQLWDHLSLPKKKVRLRQHILEALHLTLANAAADTERWCLRLELVAQRSAIESGIYLLQEQKNLLR